VIDMMVMMLGQSTGILVIYALELEFGLYNGMLMEKKKNQNINWSLLDRIQVKAYMMGPERW